MMTPEERTKVREATTAYINKLGTLLKDFTATMNDAARVMRDVAQLRNGGRQTQR